VPWRATLLRPGNCSARARRARCRPDRRRGLPEEGLARDRRRDQLAQCGNVRETRLREIWEKSEAIAFNRRRTVDDLWGFCRTCYYAETCMAGCTWTSHALMGRPGNNPMCHHRALEMDRQGLRERLVKVKDAPGRSFDHGEFEIVVEPAPARVPERIVVHG
jgi:radical SAM protein with 4Fe4S-binding SPASM domain